MSQKTFFVSILTAILYLAVTVSCGEDPINQDDPVLDIRSELPLPRFSPSGGSAELVFDSNLPWNIKFEPAEGASEGWYSVSADSGAAGNNISVTITAEPNESYEDRSFVLTLKNDALQKAVEIIQSHKNVILIGDNTYNVTSDAQQITVEVQSNVEYEVSITDGADWIGEVPRSKSLTTESHSFEISANPEETQRQGIIIFKDLNSDLYDEITIIQAGFVDPVPDRTALKDFYKAAGGDGWKNSTNWCGDKPLNEWYGVEIDSEGRVTGLRLSRNNLQGNMLKTLVRLTGLKYIDLSWNTLNGDFYSINDDVAALSSLEHIDLSHNEIAGMLPGQFCQLTKLVYIDFSSNRIENSLPLRWQSLLNNAPEVDIIVYNNRMGGYVPPDFQNHPDWNRLALQIMRQGQGGGGLDTDNGYYLPDFTLTDLADGTEKNIRDIYGNNELTFIVNWDPFQEESNRLLSTLIRKFYTQYHAQGLEVIAITPEGDEYREEAKRYIAQHNLPWITVTDYRDAKGRRLILMPYPYPSFMVISRTGEVVSDHIDGQYDKSCKRRVDLLDLDYVESLRLYLYEKLGNSSYESVDYSMDMQYEVLQTATRGNGVDVVFMGDAFLDVDVEIGYYKDIMKAAMEHFFSIEPTKSYREYFNVYMVYAISQKPYFSEYPQTALGTVKVDQSNWYDTGIEGNTGRCSYYARQSPIKNIFTTTTVIITNNHAGVGQSYIKEIGDTYAYCGNRNDINAFQNIILHEATGHGFGLLADEYWRTGVIPQSEINYLRQLQSFGIHLNVDLTDNPNSVLWSHLIGHPKYPYVSVYEGGFYYPVGVWRSERTSIMRGSAEESYFNARSRELIVKRILTHSGEGYTFEKFLAKDSDEGRPSESSLQSVSTASSEGIYQHHRPIFIER